MLLKGALDDTSLVVKSWETVKVKGGQNSRIQLKVKAKSKLGLGDAWGQPL